jgi:hypothetical protein
MTILRLAAALSVVSLVVVGCAGGASSGVVGSTPRAVTGSATTASPSAAPAVTVTRDVRFATAPPDLASWSDPLMDVYAPDGAQALPLVVLLPAHATTKDDSPAYAQLATAIAERGAVAVVANWSQLVDPSTAFTDPTAFSELSALGQSMAGCAVSYAVAHAGDHGADPSRLVLAGELFGANAASMVALGSPDPLPGCGASADWTATGLAGVNDDWLALFPAFDGVPAAAVEGQSPWGLLDDSAPMPVVLVTTQAGQDASTRCGERDAAWMADRDPSGAMRARLDQVQAYADGCVDDADEARAMAAELATHPGFTARAFHLANDDGGTQSDPGAHLQRLGASDLADLADAVVALTR